MFRMSCMTWDLATVLSMYQPDPRIRLPKRELGRTYPTVC